MFEMPISSLPSITFSAFFSMPRTQGSHSAIRFGLTKPDTVYFSSAATKQPVDFYEEMKKRWMSQDEFYDLFDQYEETTGIHFLGALPPELASHLGAGKQGFQKLDELANLLSRHFNVQENKWVDALSVSDNKVQSFISPLHIKGLDAGDQGRIYQIGNGKSVYAFKIYDEPGMLNQFRFFTFMAAQGAKDVLKTYACSSSDKNSGQSPWLLSEFVQTSSPMTPNEWKQRGKLLIAQVARKHGIYVDDSSDRVNGVLVDPTWLCHRSDHEDITDDKFKANVHSLTDSFIHACKRAKSGKFTMKARRSVF